MKKFQHFKNEQNSSITYEDIVAENFNLFKFIDLKEFCLSFSSLFI